MHYIQFLKLQIKIINGLNDVCDFGVQTKGSKFVFSELACLFLNKKGGILGFLEAANNVTLSFIHNTTLPLKYHP